MKRIIISGGGTGGHIFPAIAIANALMKQEPDAEILFIGAKGRMEMEKVPAAGYKIKGLWISGLQRRLTLKNLLFPVKVITSLAMADQILRKFKPDVVIGVGGYASGPTLRMAVRRKIPALIQEQNSYPGITNKLLGGNVDRICVAYEGMERFFPKKKIILTGNPVRQDILINKNKNEALDYFKLNHEQKIILIMGGSLGAGTINKSVIKYLESIAEKDNIQLLWQTGKYYYDQIESNQAVVNMENVRIFPFIDRMDLAYTAAEIIVSRAGAIAISELCIVGKPVILIPSPNVAEDHQTKNAEALVTQSAAWMIKDREAEEKLFPMVNELAANQEMQHELRKNIRMLAIPDAADRIAEESLKLITKE
ncbi:MAG: undecaprenyldiphospho-muramoylpentapeptide beta-N-acetylglucosaminyltransferase [Bacteroidetes bacterium]|nr:undecaprenyldiphospho-muramoylpentapeptide beta-N-acetylglucosaminyltransferase [Bacteroidota bacterium]